MLKKFTHKRMLVMIIMMLLLISIIPASVGRADSWSVRDQGPDATPQYYYTGEDKQPDGLLGRIMVGGQSNPVQKYELKHIYSASKFWTYCSDFATKPVASNGEDETLLYTRIPLESVTEGEWNFFSDDSVRLKEKTAKLRAILLKSDLWLKDDSGDPDLEKIRALTKIPRLTHDEWISATQIAIWKLVNSIIPASGQAALSYSNVVDCVAYLEGLDGVPPEDMAKIQIENVTKETSGADSYQVTVNYKVTGQAVDKTTGKGDVVDNNATATYTKDGQTTGIAVVFKDDDDAKAAAARGEYQFTISGIPMGAKLNVELSCVQKNVDSIYLFYPNGGRGKTQTLVSVQKDNVPLHTDMEVDSPSNLGRVTIYKDWLLEGGSLAPNALVGKYESVFRFTYHKGGFDGVQVCADMSITGNDRVTTGDMFEISDAAKTRLYKVEEIEANGKEVDPAKVKYFKLIEVAGGNKQVVWTDENGKELDQTRAAYFTNDVGEKPGTLTVKKEVRNRTLAQEAGRGNDEFTFKIEYQKPGDTEKNLFAGEEYTRHSGTDSYGLHTDPNGILKLAAGDTAEFTNIPAGWTMYVTEIDPDVLEDYYELDDNTRSHTFPLTEEPGSKTLSFTNTYLLGSLTVSKDITGTALDWDAFTETNPITVTITGPGKVTHTVDLYKGKTSHTFVDLPLGTYTVTESAAKGGYTYTATVSVNAGQPQNLTVTGGVTEGVTAAVGKVNIAPSGDPATVKFTNSYTKIEGSLIISKKVVDHSETVDTNKEFTFTITQNDQPVTDLDGKPVGPVTLKHNESVRFYHLAPGKYIVTETNAAIDGLNWTVTVNGKTNSAETVEVEDQKEATAEFTNTYSKQSGRLWVTKEVDGALNNNSSEVADNEFTVTVTGPGLSTDVVGTLTLKKSNNWTDGLSGLTPGTYTVTETNTGRDITNYTVAAPSYDDDQTIAVVNNETAEVTVTNTYTRQTGSVQFKKVVTADKYSYATDTFEFKVDISKDTFPTDYIAAGNVVCSTGTVTTTRNSNGTQLTISGVKDGQTITLNNLPSGAEITFTETVPNTYTLESVTVGASTASNGAKVTVPAEDTAGLVTFTNARKITGLTVTKTLSGADWSDFPGGIEFTITGPAGWTDKLQNATKTLLTPSPEDSNTTYTFRLNATTQSIPFAPIPAGNYTVEETVSTAERDGYSRVTSNTLAGGTNMSSSANKREATITATAGATITFKNEYTFKVGTLNVTKRVVDGFDDTTTKFGINIAFDPAIPANVTLTVKIGGETVSNPGWVLDGSNNKTGLKVELTAGQTVTIEGIPDGTVCTVTEDANSEYSSKITSVPADGKITDKGKVDITVTNTRTTSYGQITKMLLVGSELLLTPNDVEVKFHLEKTDGIPYETDITVKINTNNGSGLSAITKLPQGTYEITEVSITNVTGYTRTGNDLGARTITVGASNTQTSPAEITVENYYTRDKGNLTISKVFATNSEQVWKDFLNGIDVYITGPADWTGSGGTKINDGDYEGSYKFTLTAAEPYIELENIPTGEYTVTEVAEKEGYTWTASYVVDSGSSTKGNTASNVEVSRSTAESPKTTTVTFTNNYTQKTGGLDVTKTVVLNNKPAWEDATLPTYTFTLYKSGGTFVPNAKYTIDIGTDNLYTEDDGTFTLSADQTAHFTGLPDDDYYVVEGTPGSVTDYTFVSTVGDGSANSKKVAQSNGDNIPKITVINTYTRNLGGFTVTKKYQASSNETTLPAEQEFTFQLYAGTDINDTTKLVTNHSAQGSASTDANGEFTITVTAVGVSQTATFTGLPTGTYTVVETDPNIAGYTRIDTSTAADNDGVICLTVTTGDSSNITFTNIYERQRGNLTVTKQIGEDSELEALNANWAFNFTIQGPEDWDGSISDGTKLSPPTAVGKGLYAFQLTNAKPTLELKNIPGGEYVVTENGAPDGVDTDVLALYDHSCNVTVQYGDAAATPGGALSGVADVGADQDEVTVTFTNTYTRKVAELTIWKEVSGVTGAIAQEKQFTFELLGPDGKTATIAIMGGKSSPAQSLPTGTYKIREITNPASIAIANHEFKGYQFAITGGSLSGPDQDGWYEFDLAEGKTITITCTNSYDKDGAKLRVTKEVAGYASSTDTFAFRLEGTFDGQGLGVGGKNSIDRWTYDIEENGEVTKNAGSAEAVDTGGLRFELKAGQTAVFSGLDPGVGYTVTEITSAMPAYFTLTEIKGEAFSFDKVSGVETAGSRRTITGVSGDSFSATTGSREDNTYPGLEFTFTNTRNTGSLVLTKELEGPRFDDDPFIFYVNFWYIVGSTKLSANLEDIAATGWLKVGNTVIDKNSTYLKGNRLVLELQPWETVVISGIPSDLHYTVEENAGEQLYNIKYSGYEGVIGDDEEPAACTVTNSRKYGWLDVTKSVRGGGREEESEFNVIMTFFPGNDANEWYDNVLDKLNVTYFKVSGSGVVREGDNNTVIVEFKIKDGETVKITDIPAGTAYTVVEDPIPDGYICYIVGDDGRVDPHLDGHGKANLEEDHITIFNYNAPHDSLIISKLVEIDALYKSGIYDDEFFNFTLWLNEPGSGSGYFLLKIKPQQELIDTLLNEIDGKIEELSQQRAEMNSKYNTDKQEAYAAALALLKESVQVDENGKIKRNENGSPLPTDELRASKMVECAYCNGTGEIEVWPLIECPTCDGTGEVTVDGIDPNTPAPLVEGGGTGNNEGGDTGDNEGGGTGDNEGGGTGDNEGGGTGNNEGDGIETIGSTLSSFQLFARLSSYYSDGDDDGTSATATCTTCNGSGQVEDTSGNPEFEPCQFCEGTGQVEDVTAIAAAMEEALKQFYEDPAVQLFNSIQDLTDRLNELWKNRDKLINIQGKLDSGTYVEFTVDKDNNYAVEITLEENDPNVLRLNLDPAQITVKDADGNTRTLDEISFTWQYPEGEEPDSTNLYYTFKLKHGWSIIIGDLPVGATFRVAEETPRDHGLEQYTGTNIDTTGNDGGNIWSDGLLAGGDIGGLVIYTNHYEPALGEISVEKEWEDDPPADAEVTVVLTINGFKSTNPAHTLTLKASNEWRGSIDNLELGHTYGFEETEGPEGFYVNYSSTGIYLGDPTTRTAHITVTNSTEPPPPPPPDRTSLTVIKSWPNGNGSITQITVWLVADGVRTNESRVLRSANGWQSVVFDDLDPEVTYSVMEDVPAGYSATYSGLSNGAITITNSTGGGGGDDEGGGGGGGGGGGTSDIYDAGVPLGNTPDIPEPIEIPEEYVPLGNLPQTGVQYYNLLGWIGLCVGALMLLIGMKKFRQAK